MNSALNAACSINHINTPSYHFKYKNTCIMDVYLIIYKNTLSEIRDENHSVNSQGLCGSWVEVEKLLVVGINEPVFLSAWQKIMYTSGSINGSNKSSIYLPLDRMAAVPASTHSSLNAKLLLRGLFPPHSTFLEQDWTMSVWTRALPEEYQGTSVCPASGALGRGAGWSGQPGGWLDCERINTELQPTASWIADKERGMAGCLNQGRKCTRIPQEHSPI